MLRRWLYAITAKRPCRLIDVEGRPYLERYYLGKFFGVTFYLHRFIHGDGDRDVHDHPWRLSVAMVLAGGYVEERVTRISPDGWAYKIRHLYPGKPNIIRYRDFHRIRYTHQETWTLFCHTRRIKTWGFLRTTDASGLLYHQPYDVSGSLNWHTQAKIGEAAGREPYGGATHAA